MFLKKFFYKAEKARKDFPGGPVVKNPPAKAGGLVLRPGPRRFLAQPRNKPQQLQGNQAPTPRLLSSCITARECPSLTASREKPVCGNEDLVQPGKQNLGDGLPLKDKKRRVCVEGSAFVGSFQFQGGLVTKEELAKETDKECWWRRNVFPGSRRKARNKVVREK